MRAPLPRAVRATIAPRAGLAPAYVHDFADGLRFYRGPVGNGPVFGRWLVGTIRHVGVLLAVPGPGHLIWACYEGAGLCGWRGATGSVAGGYSMWFGGIGGYVETARHVFGPSDVGRLFVAHATVEQGVGARLYMGGVEVGARTGPVTITTPAASDRMLVGQHPVGYVNNNVGHHAISLSPVVMTADEIAVDAAETMARRRGLVLPMMPGEDVRWVADDAGAAWVDRIGGVSLERVGAVRVSRVSM